MTTANLKITRQKKHPFDTAYAGITLRPGSQIITDITAIATLLADKRFQQDRAAKLFEVVEENLPGAEELAAAKAPSVTDVLNPQAMGEGATIPELLTASSVDEAKVLAGQKVDDVVPFVEACAEPHVLFALYQIDKRVGVRKAVADQLEKVYKRKLTEDEILGAGVAK